ncbi:gliding motility-associated ABC transporter substrate-binding protein GldG [Capnocytophaga canimorsus]|uniref:Gliding motility-associated ABC transporter substrate-binding protein GldG n=1 Tax=Capnocytophaga canimorsus TaxID=28188 RepID=A0AAC9Z4M7_9FLAO|nr:gliding motility-associated ABC transporter substrate-binding protein GldG [Capnocytophaga canimorsus]ATA94744.1 gliding motility-associated ABC transporter substrate-binding protein GldG [Capnocytophaga canimorsus]
MKNTKDLAVQAVFAFLGLLAINLLANFFFFRWDITEDKRYTLSETSLQTLKKIETPILIEVLLKGDIPPTFKKLQTETMQLLEEYVSENNHIRVQFINPLEGESNPEQTLNELTQMGLTPLQITQSEAGKSSIAHIFPWAIVNDGIHTEKVALFTNSIGATDQEQVLRSVQRLEYNFTDALHKLTLEKQKKIAVLKSNGTLEDIYIADFLKTAGNYYRIAPFSLDSVAVNPEKTLQQLNEFDLLLIAKPTQPFTDVQKQVVDQFIMQGGKTLWMVEQVNIGIEDLYNAQGTAMAMPVDLNLGDMFFQYGFRLNYNLINDLYFTEIVIASGQGNQSRYLPLPWLYHPMVISKNNHLINKNLDATRLQFANSIDTLQNGIQKTILLSSSALSKVEGTPREISLKIDPKKMDKAGYNQGNFPVSVLLEGQFNSVYKNRIPPIEMKDQKEVSSYTKMMVISDGDFIKNEIASNTPLELGYDKWTHKFYDNKSFLINALNYLLDENDLLTLRNKKVQLAFLDKAKIEDNQKAWQLKSILLPLLIVLILSFLVKIYHKKTYSR